MSVDLVTASTHRIRSRQHTGEECKQTFSGCSLAAPRGTHAVQATIELMTSCVTISKK